MLSNICFYKKILANYIKDHNLFVVDFDNQNYKLFFRFPFVPSSHLMSGTFQECHKKCDSLNRKVNNLIKWD